MAERKIAPAWSTYLTGLLWRAICHSMNPCINSQRLGSFLLSGFLAASATCAEANRTIGQTNKVPLLLTPARVFDAVDGRTHDGWAVLVTSNKINAAGPAAQIQVPS